MLKRLVTIQEFVKVSSVLNPDNINLELDIDSALNNFNNLSTIDKQTIKLQQYLDQAGKQIDSFSNGQIYNMWDYINSIIEAGPNEHVNSIQIADYKNNIDTIKYVIIKWVEVFIYTHQIFVDANVEAPSNLQFNIEGKSDNANIESTRLDLINILNTTFFFEKVYVTGSVEDNRFNPFTDLGQFSGLEIGSLDNPNYKFNNGYIVKDVPYLGLENKARLDLLEPRVDELEKTEQGLIDRVDGIQDNVNTLHRQVDKNTEDIEAIKGGSGVSLDSLDKRITANLEKITKNTNDINQNKIDIGNIKTELTETTARSKKTRSDLGGFYNQYLQKIEDLQAEITKNDQRITSIETGFQWKGEWNESTNYSKNDQVTYQGITYTSEADNNQGFKPSDYPQYWKPTSTEFTNAIKNAVDNLDKKLNPKIEQNQKDIETNKESINDLDQDLNNAITRIATNESAINDLKTLTQTHTNQINTILGGSSGISLKTLNDRVTTLESDNTTNKNDINALKTNTAKLNANNTYENNVRNIFRALPEVYTETTLPTRNVELTTKKYVDDQDKLNAKLGSSNTFTSTNTFNGSTIFSNNVSYSQRLTIDHYFTTENFKGVKNITGNTHINFGDRTNTDTWIAINQTRPVWFSRNDDKNAGTESTQIYQVDKLVFNTYNKTNSRSYYLNANGPEVDNDIANVKWVKDNFMSSGGASLDRYLDKETTTAQTVKSLVNFNAGINSGGYRVLTTNDESKYARTSIANTWSATQTFDNLIKLNFKSGGSSSLETTLKATGGITELNVRNPAGANYTYQFRVNGPQGNANEVATCGYVNSKAGRDEVLIDFNKSAKWIATTKISDYCFVYRGYINGYGEWWNFDSMKVYNDAGMDGSVCLTVQWSSVRARLEFVAISQSNWANDRYNDIIKPLKVLLTRHR